LCKRKKRHVPPSLIKKTKLINKLQLSLTNENFTELAELIALLQQLGIDLELSLQYAKGLAKNGCTSPASLLLVENENDLEICGIKKRFHILSIMNWIKDNKKVEESIPVASFEESIPVAKVMEA
jgi:hypothetical protein